METQPPRKPYPTDVTDEWAFVAPHLGPVADAKSLLDSLK
jgi:hypothetical protein